MANADQLKTLIKSHFDNDLDRFATVALQLAAHEARSGHLGLARDIRDMVDRAKVEKKRIVKLNRELLDLVEETKADTRLQQLVVPPATTERIKRITREFRQQHKLKQHGLIHRRRLLLAGPPGTGKTMTAAILAKELDLPLYTILMDRLMSKYMGETSAKLRQIFDVIETQPGVYLFDEFDAIGSERAKDNDVGEMRRVLNAFLQFIDFDTSDSLIVAATNTPSLLDQALFRRFDDILYYNLPNQEEVKQLVKNRLGGFAPKKLPWAGLLKYAESLSHAEVAMACDDAVKEAILDNLSTITTAQLNNTLKNRQAVYHQRKGTLADGTALPPPLHS